MASLELDNPAVIFVIDLVISTIIIFIITRLFGKRKNITKAFITAIIGTIVYSIANFLFGHGSLTTIAGGVAWLLALKGLYGLSWTRAAIIAIIIWIVSYFVTVASGLPTAAGPL